MELGLKLRSLKHSFPFKHAHFLPKKGGEEGGGGGGEGEGEEEREGEEGQGSER